MIRAVIYCRVSSKRQVKDGHGNESQEKRCQDYAKAQKYNVIGVFPEEGITGGLFERPAMRELLKFLEENDSNDPEDKIVVIFDDLKRFARDTEIHFGLKREIYGRNGRVECPNFRFEDSPEGRFVETIIAATGELERNQNKRQVIQKMKARLELGYWAFASPVGLQMVRDPMHGKLLRPKEPFSSILKTAIEDFRDGLLQTIEDFRHFILAKYKEHGIKKGLSSSGARDILTQILYTGWIKYDEWNVSLRKGKHEGFISMDTYNKVQTRLNQKSRPWKRKDYKADFALRGHVICNSCANALTASWNKGRSKSYANYWCVKEGCEYRYKCLYPKGRLILILRHF